MRSTKTIQSRQVIHSVINQVKVNKSLNYSVNFSQYVNIPVEQYIKWYIGMSSDEENWSSVRKKKALSYIVVTLDHFKGVNP